MKAIEVKKGDKVVYHSEVCIVLCVTLNAVLLESEEYGTAYTTSYSQIEKYEQEGQLH